MKPPHRIVVPVALPHDARPAVEVAAALATSLDADLVLAGIAPLVPPEPARDSPATVSSYTRRAEQQALVDRLVGERLQELAGELGGGVRVRTLVTWGAVGPALVAAARDEHADLIVVPMRREREWRHVIHDHADRHVLHHSDVPVLVVPAP